MGDRLMSGWRNRLFGSQGERAASRYLKKLGYRIVVRNYENRYGEIDLIALDGETIVFIEVKTRRSDRTGSPLEAVGPDKQRQILKTAQAYLHERKLLDHSVRYDVLGLLWPDEANQPEIQHVRAAFPE